MKKNILLFLFCFCFSFVFGSDWHITQNIPPLATPYTSPGNIIIYSGVDYNITSSGVLRMPAGARIIIQPGGKLTVDGGQITSIGTNIMWDGIFVISSNRILGGIASIEVKNNALIQNANIAIRTWDGSSRITGGGAVKISNSTFRNNCISLQVVSDELALSNSNQVIKSRFVLDNSNYFSSNNLSFKAHAEIDARSFTFKGCVFENLTSLAVGASARGSGIIAYNSILYVSGYCDSYDLSKCICNMGYVPSYFSGFYRAINYTHSGEGSRNKLNVSDTNFDRNWHAISTAGMNCDITKCKFSIPYASAIVAITVPCGIYLNNCSGYKLEENTFIGAYSSSLLSSSIGVRVINSGIADNLIYRNYFENLNSGIEISGTNGVVNGAGLQFQCNDFNSNIADVYIWASATVASQQGLPSKSAGNTFKGSGVNIAGNDYMNIIYYYSGANSSNNIYQPTVRNRVGAQSGAVVNDCKPKNCSKFVVVDTAIISIIDTLPFVRDTSIFIVGKRDIAINYDNLNDQYNNLVADFHEKGYDWILEDYTANSKGNSEIDLEAINALEKLNEISEIGMLMSEISSENINQLLNTQDADLEEFIEWYEKINTPAAKYSLANSYYENGEYDKALQVLSNIPDMFNFEQKELAEHDDYMLIHKLRDNLRTSNRYWDKLTEAEISLLEKIAVNTIGPSSAKAQGILCFFYDNCIEIDQKNIPMNEIKETTKINVDIYPNPAKNILNIDFSDEIEGNAQIEFYDIMGRKVYSHNINTTSSQINISELSNGVYTYKIIYNDNEMTHDKFIKQ